jgi:hypothetical protein
VKRPAEFTAFSNLVSRILSVPHEEIMRREGEYRAEVDANPNRPGPKRGWKPPKKKRKAKQPSASPGSDAEPRA